jgi:hypothetical protein
MGTTSDQPNLTLRLSEVATETWHLREGPLGLLLMTTGAERVDVTMDAVLP